MIVTDDKKSLFSNGQNERRHIHPPREKSLYATQRMQVNERGYSLLDEKKTVIFYCQVESRHIPS